MVFVINTLSIFNNQLKSGEISALQATAISSLNFWISPTETADFPISMKNALPRWVTRVQPASISPQIFFKVRLAAVAPFTGRFNC